MTVYRNDPGLVSLWLMNEFAAARADNVGANPLTNNGASEAPYLTCKEGTRATNFDAVGTEWLSITDGAQTGLDITGAFTMCGWLNLTSNAATMGLAGKYTTAGNQRGYVIEAYHDGANMILRGTVSADGTAFTAVNANTALSTGTWYHVAFVYDGVDIRLYLDGALDCTPVAHTTGVFDNNAPFEIGRWSQGAPYLDGITDEWAVFNRALSVGEIAAIEDEGIKPHHACDFETGDFTQWDDYTTELCYAYSGTIVEAPVREGQYAGRFEVRNAALCNGDERAEVDMADTERARMNTDYWHAWSTFIPTDWVDCNGFCLISQWHGTHDVGELSRSPPLSLWLINGNFQFITRQSAVKIMANNNDGVTEVTQYNQPAIKGDWVDFVVHVHWSYQSDGYLEIWMNGNKIVDYSGPTTYNDDIGPYFKQGIYRSVALCAGTNILYHDGYKTGSSYADVAATVATDDVLFATVRTVLDTGGGRQYLATSKLGGMAPKAVLFTVTRAVADATAASHAALSIGAATSSSQRGTWGCVSENGQATTDTARQGMSDECFFVPTNSGAVDGESDFVVFTKNGCETNAGSAYGSGFLLTATFIAGDDLSAKVVDFAPANALNDTVAVTGVGWQADVGLFFTGGFALDSGVAAGSYYSYGCAIRDSGLTQRANVFASADAAAAAAVNGIITENYACGQISTSGSGWIWGGEVTEWGNDGITVTTREGASGGADDVVCLLLRFNNKASFWLDTISTPIATGVTSQTGLGFTPQFIHGGLTQLPTADTLATNGDAGSIGVSTADATNQYCDSCQDEDGADPTDAQSFSDDAIANLPQDDGTPGHVVDFGAFNDDGWSWDFTTTDGTPRQWWMLAVSAPLVFSTQTFPLGASSHLQSREMTLVVKQPLAVGNAVLGDTMRPEGLRVIWTAQGGHWSLTFNLRGRQSEIEDWIDGGLGRQIELYSPDLMLIWTGFVSKVSGNIGGLSIARGPLIETVANKIQVAYSTVDYSISPPAVGVRDNTDWAQDTDSQAKYGIIERVVSLAGSTLTGAEQVRDVLLDEMAEPVSDETDNIGSRSETSVTIECLGWVHWLNAYTYYSTTQGDTTASAKIQAVLGADPNSIFSADYSDITTNAAVVGAWDDDYKRAWDVIKGIVSLGDASQNRYLFGVYGIDRKAKYNAIPTTIKYQRALADPGQWLELYGSGSHVNPWDVTPGEWVFYTDLLVGKAPATSFRTDPRHLFIEQAQYSAPWALSMQGGKSSRLDQLLAQMGLGGSSG